MFLNPEAHAMISKTTEDPMSVIQFPCSVNSSPEPRELNALEARIWALRRKVYSVCYKMANGYDGQSAVAEDLAMVAIEKAIAKQHLFRREANLDTWVISIARNVAIDHIRTRKRNVTEISLDVPWQKEIAEQSFARPDAFEDDLMQRQAHRKLNEAIDRLPPKIAMVMALRVQGLQYVEICTLLSLREGTVKSRIHRGTLMLIEIVHRQRQQQFDS